MLRYTSSRAHCEGSSEARQQLASLMFRMKLCPKTRALPKCSDACTQNQLGKAVSQKKKKERKERTAEGGRRRRGREERNVVVHNATNL